MEELEKAERLVREWETHVSRAEALLADLEQTHRGQAAAIVRRCPMTFIGTLESHRIKLAVLRARSGEPHEYNEQHDQRDAGGDIDHP